MELQKHLGDIQKRGLGIAAISYDSAAILKNFADRQHITFPLLSDPQSQIIRAFGILNETSPSGSQFYGIPYPGTFIVDPAGKVLSKYFEEDYRERVDASDILVRQFGETAAAAKTTIQARHARLTAAAATDTAMPGHRIALSLEIDLPANMHVYAPGVEGYIPIDWQIEPDAAAKQHSFDYPKPEKLHLKAINETVPVYRNRVHLTREITLAAEPALKPLLTPNGELVINGSFRYQACDDKICYTPETVPLTWRFQYVGLDRQRAPSELQRK